MDSWNVQFLLRLFNLSSSRALFLGKMMLRKKCDEYLRSLVPLRFQWEKVHRFRTSFEVFVVDACLVVETWPLMVFLYKMLYNIFLFDTDVHLLVTLNLYIHDVKYLGLHHTII